MAASYVLSIGYGNTHTSESSGLFEQLKETCEKVVNRGDLAESLIDLYYLLPLEGTDPSECDGVLMEYIDIYKLPFGHGGPVSFNTNDCTVSISCSGGGESRRIKEAIARKFCRTIMELMGRHEINVNLNVV